MTFIADALQQVEVEGSYEPVLTHSDQAVFERLWVIDEAHRQEHQSIADNLSDMDRSLRDCDGESICNLKPLLLSASHNLQERLEELQAIDTLGDKAHEVWKTALKKSIEHTLGILGVSGYADVSGSLVVTDPEVKIVDTSAYCANNNIHAF